MFLCEYDFFPDASKNDLDGYWHGPLSCFLAALYQNGALLGSSWHLLPAEDRIRLTAIVPTEDALDARYYDRWASQALERLMEQSRRPPTFQILGKALGLPDCCLCPSPGWYVLFTTFLNDRPPVECGDCGRSVPLYRLPLSEEETPDIRRWGVIYQACDMLFIQSGVGERFGYRQMSRFDSPLSREGREICRAMSERMGRPWYYHLTRYYRRPEPRCPGCGEAWKLEAPLPGLYTHRCDRCCLLSMDNAAPLENRRTPDGEGDG
jgi:predicted  nucleic acid-binding Zn ribbon protein